LADGSLVEVLPNFAGRSRLFQLISLTGCSPRAYVRSSPGGQTQRLQGAKTDPDKAAAKRRTR
jgi:hypothetical protein